MLRHSSGSDCRLSADASAVPTLQQRRGRPQKFGNVNQTVVRIEDRVEHRITLFLPPSRSQHTILVADRASGHHSLGCISQAGIATLSFSCTQRNSQAARCVLQTRSLERMFED